MASETQPKFSQLLEDQIRLVLRSKTRLGYNEAHLLGLARLVMTRQIDVLEAIRERESQNTPVPQIPFAWGLTSGETVLLRELLDKPGLSHDEVLRAAGSRGEPRAIIHRVNRKLVRIMPGVRIARATGQGYGLGAAEKAVIRRNAIEQKGS